MALTLDPKSPTSATGGPSLFAQSVAAIDAEYQRLDYALGWRFMMSPSRTLTPGARTLVLTQNPGGKWEPSDHPRASQERGSAYRLESWPIEGPNSSRQVAGGAKLQLQVQAMFRWLGEDIDKTPTGYFVPFRSPSWDALPKQDEALDFARHLWKPILDALRPKLILCIGIDQAFSGASEMTGAVAGKSLPIGWGNYSARTATSQSTMIVGLPHLSRFGIFGRDESVGALAAIKSALADFREPQ